MNIEVLGWMGVGITSLPDSIVDTPQYSSEEWLQRKVEVPDLLYSVDRSETS